MTDATNTLNGTTRRERRTATRAPFDAAVSCEFFGQSILDYTANLSEGGVYIRTDKLNAPLGAPVKVTLRVPGMAARVHLQGWVVRVDVSEDGTGVAIRFAELPEDVSSAIQKLVSTH